MLWVVLWLVLSVPVALVVGSFIANGHRRRKHSTWDDQLGPEFHDQTIVGE